MSETTPEVRDVPELSRFEIRVGGELAGFTAYIRRPPLMTFTHTEVDPRFEGQGVGGRLVSQALDATREEGLAVIPVCPFVRAYIAGHPAYLDLVPAGRRAEFGLPAGP
jgi:predicted GNAT family acetyltransferase